MTSVRRDNGTLIAAILVIYYIKIGGGDWFIQHWHSFNNVIVMILNRPYLSRLVRHWIGWEESDVGFLHVHFTSRRLVLQVVGAVTSFMTVFPVAWHGEGLACVPPWHVESIAESHVPIIIELVRARCSC